jgi:3-hydroxyacyl-CoA dehydrogenase
MTKERVMKLARRLLNVDIVEGADAVFLLNHISEVGVAVALCLLEDGEVEKAEEVLRGWLQQRC